jgi:hypothetical protein
MTTHFCCSCQTEKPIGEFYRNRAKASGHHCHCKECMKAKVKTHTQSARGRELKRDRDRRYREEQRPWANADYDRRRYAAGRTFAPPDPEKLYARKYTRNLIRLGLVSRPTTCERCDREHPRIEAHHPDYSQPDVFEFLCRPCHGKQHRVEPRLGPAGGLGIIQV